MLAMEGEGTVEVAAEDASSDAKPVDNQGTASPGCTIQMFVGGVVKWDTLQEIALLKTLS